MSETRSELPQAARPGSFPGRTAIFPAHVGRVAYGIFGIQAKTAADAAPFVAEWKELFWNPGGPGALERFRYTDPQGYACDLFLAGWLDAQEHARWFARRDVQAWWRGLPDGPDSPVGFWREVMTPHKDYFQYGAGVDEKAGFATLGEIVPSEKFGYWGGYRDRVPASAHDKFLTPLDGIPEPAVRETRGRRLSVRIPDNICFIREGQGWDRSGAEERRIWKEKMEGVVDEWVSYLRDNPAETGCLSLRFCREQDVTTGADREKQSQIAFLLSLRHIERAARTVHTHLAVKDTLTAMYREPKFEPRMHIWVEMFILKSRDLETEYVNCHPQTGLLPYFDATLVSTGALEAQA